MRLTSNRSEDKAFQRRALIALGMATVAFGALIAYVGYHAPNSVPGRHYYNLKAEFRQADNLSEHYQIRVGGRLVGQVLHPRARGGLAVVDLQMKTDVKPLLSDTRLRVRPRSAIGVRFVEIIPGTRGVPLHDGDLIRASQTSTSLPLDVAFNILDRQRRAKLRTLIAQLGEATAGRGEDLNVAVGKGAAFFDGLNAGLAPLNRRPGAVAGFVSGLEGFAAAADPVRHDIAEGFRPEADALKPLSTHAGALRATLDEAPRTLTAARDELPPTTALLARTAGFARAATPVLRDAPQAFTQTSALLRSARPSLRTADETLRLAQRAVPPTLGLLRTVRPVLPTADDTLVDGVPLVSQLARYRCDLSMWSTNWADATMNGDTGGEFLRLIVVRPGKEQIDGLGRVDRSGIGTNSYPAPCTADKERLP